MTEEQSFRPFVQVACICQAPLQEANGGLSIIRITERILVAGTTDEMQPWPVQNLFLVIVLKAGFLRQKAIIKVDTVTPSGKVEPGPEWPALFEGDDRGVAICVPFGLIATEEGLYWIDVLVEKERLTRIPFRVIYQKMQQQPGFPFQPPAPIR